MTIAALKEGLRKEALERRAALKPRVTELSRILSEIFLRQIPVPSGATISAYVAIGDEADPAPLLQQLRQTVHALAVLIGKTPESVDIAVGTLTNLSGPAVV